ncbi:type II toxin-antitoxin system RelE/ParE family toxin [bacterium SCSIO 12643]|nr:type II toxin-antitoxin system RelE/ParE family toxin [bacterium SCSIO 12643]
MGELKIIWSKQAQEAVKSIYDYYKDKSLQGAKNVKRDILQSPKNISYSKQYQVDEINPKYRRIVVRDYKVLYNENNNVIEIMDVISTLQSPEILKNK